MAARTTAERTTAERTTAERTTADRLAVWIGRVVGLLAVFYAALGAWVVLGRPTSVGPNGSLLGSVASIVVLVAVTSLLAERTSRWREGRHSL